MTNNFWAMFIYVQIEQNWKIDYYWKYGLGGRGSTPIGQGMDSYPVNKCIYIVSKWSIVHKTDNNGTYHHQKYRKLEGHTDS